MFDGQEISVGNSTEKKTYFCSSNKLLDNSISVYKQLWGVLSILSASKGNLPENLLSSDL